jgi:hypothetical protein
MNSIVIQVRYYEMQEGLDPNCIMSFFMKVGANKLKYIFLKNLN